MKKILILIIALSYNSLVAQDFNIDQSFSGISNIIVEGKFLTVTVNGVAGDRVSLEGEIEGGSDYQIKYNVNGDKLKVWIETPNFNWGRGAEGYINLQVPDAARLNIETSSGKLKVNKISSYNMNFSTSSGTLIANSISGSGSLATTSGKLKMYDSKGDFTLNSSSGGVLVAGFKGNLVASSSSGSNYFEAVVGELTAVASSGSIKLKEVSAQLDLKTSSGRISGETVRVTKDSKLHTSSGGIKIDLANDVNNLSYNLSAGSGRVKVGNIGQGKKLVINNGGPNISAVSSSGSQHFY